MKKIHISMVLLACAISSLVHANSAHAKPSKQELETFYKLSDQLSPETIVYVDNKIKAGKDLADWYELQTFFRMRIPYYKPQDIFTSARAAARAEPKNLHVVVTYAIALVFLKKYQAAQEFLDRVLKSDPKNGRALAAQAYLFAEQNANEELAQDEMKTAIKLAPSDTSVNHLALMFYRKTFDYDSAKAALNRWISAHPNDLYPRMLLAELFRSARHRDEAIKVCREVIAMKPNLDWAHHTLISTAFDKKDYKTAAAATTELFNKIPSNKQNCFLMIHRADSYRHLQEYDKAIADYSAACESIMPGSKEKLPAELVSLDEKTRRTFLQSWIGRALMRIKTGNAQKASEELSQVLKMYPSNIGALQIRIQAYEALKKYDLAVMDADALIKKDTDVAEWYKVKARIQRKMGKEADAQATEKRLREVNEFGTR